MRSDTVKAIAALSLLIMAAAMPVTPNLVLYYYVWHDAQASSNIGAAIIGAGGGVVAAALAAKMITLGLALTIFGITVVAGIAVA